MDPVRSSLGGGLAATAALLAFLLVADLVVPTGGPSLVTTFTGLCAVGGPPYCRPTGLGPVALTLVWFVLLFGAGWPLLFAGFTWGLPGESGPAHGAVFGLVLWLGYLGLVVFGLYRGEQTVAAGGVLLAVALVAHLLYGVALGSGYDYLAGHRTFLSAETEPRDGLAPPS